jgi:serine-type D-Ala-D-Ala carboxypeptidase/endopeptidase
LAYSVNRGTKKELWKPFHVLLVLAILATLVSSLFAAGCSSDVSPPLSPTPEPQKTPEPTSEPTLEPVAPDFSTLTRLLQDAVDDVPLEGAAMLVVKDGEVLYEDYFGTYKADTIVGIASASKWLGAATVMTLVDDGLIDLDDPVSKYLPAFADEDKAGITIRQCLSHTSGLPEDCRCRWVGSMTLQDCCGEIAGLTMEAEPGVKFAYGGTSLQVAGGVAEVASGMSWADLFHEKIVVPCEMDDTSFPYPSFENPAIAGGVYTKIWDYANFLEMLLNKGVYNGKQVLSEASVNEMFKDQTEGCEPIGSRYGLGCWRDLVHDDGTVTQISSPGAQGYTPWIDLNRNMYAVFQIKDKGLNDIIEQIKIEVRNVVPSTLPDPEAITMVQPSEERGPRPPEGPASAAEAKPGELFIEFVSQDPNPSYSDASVNITCRTLPGATCFIQPINPALANGKRTISRWVEEPTQIADNDGLVSWSWHLHRHVATGNGTVEVSAELGDQKVMRDFTWENIRPLGMVSTDNVTPAMGTLPAPEETDDVPIEIISVTPQPAEPGKDPELVFVIRTVPGATGSCTLVLPVTGTTGTRPLTATNDEGVIEWHWNIHRHVAAGEATFDFTLEYDGKKSTKRYLVQFVK